VKDTKISEGMFVGKPVTSGYKFHRFWATFFEIKMAYLRLESVVTLSVAFHIKSYQGLAMALQYQ
jgi:hypothetical protein